MKGGHTAVAAEDGHAPYFEDTPQTPTRRPNVFKLVLAPDFHDSLPEIWRTGYSQVKFR
jgi:hypothetical protein